MKPYLMVVLAGSLAASGCADRVGTVNSAARGTAIGTGVGAIAGGVIGGGAGGALAGAAVGAAAGGAVGVLLEKRQPRAYYRDTRGYCYYLDRDGKTVYDDKAMC